MTELQINFRFARKEDFFEITALHFLDKKITDRGHFNFFYDKVKLFYNAGADIIVADRAGELAGVIIFVKDSRFLRKALFSRARFIKFILKGIFGFYGINKKIIKKAFNFFRAHARPDVVLSQPEANLPPAKIVSIVVDKNYRRLGIGSTLIEMSCEHLRKSGSGGVQLTVLEENAPALKMYEKLGFRVVGSCLESTGRSFIMVYDINKNVE